MMTRHLSKVKLLSRFLCQHHQSIYQSACRYFFCLRNSCNCFWKESDAVSVLALETGECGSDFTGCFATIGLPPVDLLIFSLMVKGGINYFLSLNINVAMLVMDENNRDSFTLSHPVHSITFSSYAPFLHRPSDQSN